MKTITKSIKEEYILPGEEKTVFEADGKGVVTHMWFGGCYDYFGEAVIKIYYAGCTEPEIEAKMHLFNGIGFNDEDAFVTELIGKTGHPGGVYNCYRIPYTDGIKITVTMDEKASKKDWFWSIVRATSDLELMIEGKKAINPRLVLNKVENYMAQPLEEFNIYKSSRNGCLLITTMTAQSDNLEYEECCFRGYSNGKMQLLSSGMEDYFLGTFYFQKGKFQSGISGATHFEPEKRNKNGLLSQSRFSGYRIHERDPIFFDKDFRMTMRCGECIEGKIFHNPQPTLYNVYVLAYEFDELK